MSKDLNQQIIKKRETLEQEKERNQGVRVINTSYKLTKEEKQDGVNEFIFTPQEEKIALQRNPIGLGSLSVEMAESGTLLLNLSLPKSSCCQCDVKMQDP